jgi:hypothetical protein
MFFNDRIAVDRDSAKQKAVAEWGVAGGREGGREGGRGAIAR